jgi:aspartyl-tRNA(Asn)/glutamyl-tRNA(Gln) amidotransferase subunit C
MAAISRDEVANLARLARISMSDAELDHLAGEMDVILGAVARVQEVASADVAPTSHP